MTRLACCLLLLAGGTAVADDGKLRLIVQEPAGIRRFGYPVHTTVPLPRPVTAKDRFRLVADGKPVAAQFRPAGDARAVALDFNVNVGPFEKLTYTLEYGPKVIPPPEPKGMRLEEGKDAFTVRSGGMVYVVPRDLNGLLKEVRGGKNEYLRPGSAGLSMILNPNKPHPIGGAGVKASVVRQGPLAVVLRFTSEGQVAGKKATSVVQLTFPRSKSWVEVLWEATFDREGGVVALEADLNLLVDGTPTLVDFGAGSAVYTALTKGRSALFRGRTSRHLVPGFGERFNKTTAWEVLTGRGDQLRPFVRWHPQKPTLPEGWAHIMDRQRCTALAVDRFAVDDDDAIRIDADGRLRLRRTVTRTDPPIRYRFWLHFVPMPVQVGAVTSPQSMMAPLSVLVGRAE